MSKGIKPYRKVKTSVKVYWFCGWLLFNIGLGIMALPLLGILAGAGAVAGTGYVVHRALKDSPTEIDAKEIKQRLKELGYGGSQQDAITSIVQRDAALRELIYNPGATPQDINFILQKYFNDPGLADLIAPGKTPYNYTEPSMESVGNFLLQKKKFEQGKAAEGIRRKYQQQLNDIRRQNPNLSPEELQQLISQLEQNRTQELAQIPGTEEYANNQQMLKQQEAQRLAAEQKKRDEMERLEAIRYAEERSKQMDADEERIRKMFEDTPFLTD